MTALTRLDFSDSIGADGKPAHPRTMTLDGVDADAAIAVVTTPGAQCAPFFDRPAFLRSLLGEGPSLVDDLPEGRIGILSCSSCGDPYCGFHAADLVFDDDRVLWRGLRFEWPDGMWTSSTPRSPRRTRRLLGLGRRRAEEQKQETETERVVEPWASMGADRVLEFAFDRTAYEATIREELVRELAREQLG
ncbi:hypothetical protein [Clavibacter nebraskensis]|uniref:Uncharacterized protein n=2 Tax=Clavibacter nebraskensis TaxID=31963 RepID=A0AAI8ZH25_9MICO|nr:hypothetical protein [Clavibacter nebraskensis]KXU20923.1 hypothetical protein VV38_05610 [Clavibacter nebraskensis]OAH22364.1 hypothetical protein A3Q38_02955 [Clavibacter nebraskensis]QGV66404.1 hypothetical protein EGX36_05950 [Clavibacter nebraskensis]QGV69201.1 hypothetical protein EGX37_05940 [Clavibacter nebraskensis]QGV71991.1 hypothetical protein EGX35_05940 [Clavibacter nebraskensis]